MTSGSITFFSIWKNNILSIADIFLTSLTAVWKSFFWFVLTLFFGLFQIWLVLGINNLIPTNELFFERFITDGALLFFSIAIVSSLTIDYHVFSRGIFNWNDLSLFMFLIFPMVIVFFCVLLFTVCYLKSEAININHVFYTEIVIFTITFLYTIVVKSFAFYKDQRCTKCST
ncbi:MAG: hypothetical protein DRR19_06415 [Candidatus Parabeggiatoa sp. nov. 1]|nr:MAG: hypothetical protein DRR19_06415 [Gammaproteobacteria bacterium]